MSAAMPTASSNIVQLRPQAAPAVSVPPTVTRRLECWSDSLRDEPAISLPDLPHDLVEALPQAIEEAQAALVPNNPGEVLAALTTLIARKGFDLPDEFALEMDCEIIAAWPRDLWRTAFRSVWENFSYRRIPEVADFKKVIAAELEERQARLHRLESLRLKLETVRLKRQWDEVSRERRGRAG